MHLITDARSRRLCSAATRTLLVSRIRTNFGNRFFSASLELSADRHKTARLVTQPSQTVADDFFYLFIGTKAQCESPPLTHLSNSALEIQYVVTLVYFLTYLVGLHNCVRVTVGVCFSAVEFRRWRTERCRSKPWELRLCEHSAHECSSGRMSTPSRTKQTSSGEQVRVLFFLLLISFAAHELTKHNWLWSAS